MMEQAAFEVVGRGEAWHWQLRDGNTHIAVSADGHPTPESAREQVKLARRCAARLSGKPLFDRTARDDVPTSFHIFEKNGLCFWHLRAGEEVIAVPPASYQSESVARAAVERVKELVTGAVPVMFGGSDETVDRDPFTLDRKHLKQSAATLFGRGRRHREYLNKLDARVVVMGIRGKSSTTRRIGDVFDRRGYDTLVKITGNHPHLLHNGEYIPIQRTGSRVTLYENIKTTWRYIPLLDSFSPEGIGMFENQGLTEYTTRIFNERFIQPDVIVLTNVRQDHQDTLGKTRRDIARSFSRSVPEGTHVVSGEQHPLLHDYLEQEVQKAGGTIQQVDVPEAHSSLIGAETVHAVDEVLDYFDMRTLPEAEVNGYLEAIQPNWTVLKGGSRIFNAAEVNDIESTEAARRALADDETVLPFVYLRGDRRSRTASFVDYINTLVERGLVDTVFAGGDFTDVFAKNIDAPVSMYPPDSDPERVLDDIEATGLPIFVMGNTVADFMREFESVIEQRARQATHEGADEIVVPPSTRTDEREAEIDERKRSRDEEQRPVSREQREETPAKANPATPTPHAESTPSDADTSGEHPGSEVPESLLTALQRELEETELSENQREAIAEGLGLTTPRHETIQIERLQSQVAELAAYTDAMEEFFDSSGTAREILDDLESRLDDVLDRVSELEAAVEAADDQRSDIAGRVDALEEDTAAIPELDEQLDQLREQTTKNATRLDNNERALTLMRRETYGALDELEDAVSDTRDQVSILREIERERLSQEIQEEMEEISDISAVRDILSKLRESQE